MDKNTDVYIYTEDTHESMIKLLNRKYCFDISSDTYPNFKDHRVDYAANDSNEVKHVPRIFKEVLNGNEHKNKYN